MKNFGKNSLAAAMLALSASAVQAADIIEPPIYEAPEIVPVIAAGWYLRGDIGMSNQQLHGGLYNALFENVATQEFLDEGDFSSAPVFRAGIGYQVNDWFRTDLTVEYRGKADFNALDRYDGDGNGSWDGTDDYSAKKSEWLFLANAYMDLGTWQGMTPYVGAGIGASRNTISNYRDINVPTDGVAYAGTHSEWNLAWALHAGLGFEITDRLTLDLGYSYLNLGDAQSGDVIAYDGTNSTYNPTHFNEITSHDVKFGLRYTFN